MDEQDEAPQGADDERAPTRPQRGSEPQGEIDIRLLADKVYRLMLAEARSARVRGEPLAGPGKG